MNESFDLKKICHVNTNEEGDRFVGVKADIDNVNVYFPLGYQLPDDDKLIRRDIRSLLSLLANFSYKDNEMIKGKTISQPNLINFPLQSFLDVIDYFIEDNGHYYVETEKKYKTDTKGKINWKKTIKNERPFVKDNRLIYTKFIVEKKSPLDYKLITQINRYCVYIAFQRLGWLYNNQQIENPGIVLNENNKRIFIQELQKKYRDTNKDRDKKLFKSMKSMIEFIDDRVMEKSYYFGTDNFEYVWEKIIDKVFGIPNKEDYFPKAVWTERYGTNKNNETHALMPDTIMLYEGKVYILDAKYYRYGDTKNPQHLPDSTSINKQITYGEYLETVDFKNKNKPTVSNKVLFNAFLMPYNSVNNLFDLHEKFENVAEAKGLWRSNTKYYEKIQGILVDIRYLIHNYIGNHDKDKEQLAKTIDENFLKVNN